MKSTHPDIKTKYNSMKQASLALGITVKQLKIIKEQYPEGFYGDSGLKGPAIKAYFDAHKAELVEKESDSLESLKKEKLRREITRADLAIEEARKKTVPIMEIKEFLKKLNIEVGSLLLAKLVKELPSQIDRIESFKREELCKEMYNEIIKTMQTEIDLWTPKNAK
jgi:hypothetical protein